MKNRLNMDAVKSRIRKSEKLKIGIGDRSSTYTRSAKATAESISAPEINGSREPTWGISFMAKMKRLQVNIKRIAHGRSTEIAWTPSWLSSNSWYDREGHRM